MPYKHFFILLVAVLSLGACSGEHNSKSAGPPEAAGPMGSGPVTNGISLQENGLKVEEAHLVDAKGQQLGENNTIALGDKVYCQLVVSGYHQDQGMVSIGASEEIKADDGTLILKENDLFATLGSVKAEDARYVRLMASITEQSKSRGFFNVRFRIWDKKGRGDVTGNYRFRLR